jgi:dihydrofolate synthase/folylpolyglutamate synthase
MTLSEFLNHKTMFYDKIDYTVIKKSWDILKKYIKTPYVIHIIGTNGKGSTGRFLASFLRQLGFDTLHYSSPLFLPLIVIASATVS